MTVEVLKHFQHINHYNKVGDVHNVTNLCLYLHFCFVFYVIDHHIELVV